MLIRSPGMSNMFGDVVPACRVCGSNKDVICYPCEPEKQHLTICPDCCAKVVEHPDGESGHGFDYVRDERRHECRYCGIPRDNDD